MLCPTCKIPLTMSERQGIEIDYCAQCRGIWLDRGELDKLIERSQLEEVRPQAPEPRRDAPFREKEYREPGKSYREGYSDGHGTYPRKHKRSFLSDLLDF